MSQTLKICSSGLTRPKNENKNKNERKIESKPRNRIFSLALDDLVRSSNKIFIESQRLFFLPTERRNDGMAER